MENFESSMLMQKFRLQTRTLKSVQHLAIPKPTNPMEGCSRSLRPVHVHLLIRLAAAHTPRSRNTRANRVFRVVFSLLFSSIRLVTHTQHNLPLAKDHLRRSMGRKSIDPRVDRRSILLYHTSCGFFFMPSRRCSVPSASVAFDI